MVRALEYGELEATGVLRIIISSLTRSVAYQTWSKCWMTYFEVQVKLAVFGPLCRVVPFANVDLKSIEAKGDDLGFSSKLVSVAKLDLHAWLPSRKGRSTTSCYSTLHGCRCYNVPSCPERCWWTRCLAGSRCRRRWRWRSEFAWDPEHQPSHRERAGQHPKVWRQRERGEGRRRRNAFWLIVKDDR